LSITVANQRTYKQNYTVVIAQPADLSAYTSVNNNTGNVDISLNGGNTYTIALNGKTYTTTAANISLPLIAGDNDIIITTDKFCQGEVEKHISFGGILPYPNPFRQTVSLDMGTTVKNNVTILVHMLSNGTSVYTKQLNNVSGVLQLDLSSLNTGVYLLDLTMDGVKKTFKIIKR